MDFDYKNPTSTENIFTGISMGAAVLAAVAIRNVMKSGWKKVRKTDPPENPASPETAWNEAIAWTLVTALAVGFGRLVAKRAAAEGWRKVMGDYPPNIHQTKTRKKLAKAWS